MLNEQKKLFDQDEPVSWKLFHKDVNDSLRRLREKVVALCESGNAPDQVSAPALAHPESELPAIALEYAKVDGFDVTLRSVEVSEQPDPLGAAKHWVVPVRAFLRNELWVSADGAVRGSHDEKGNVRPEYVASTPIYSDDGVLIDGVLDPDCIEARDYNLSAGQYRPFDFEELRSDIPVVDLIRDLQSTENDMVLRLEKLLAMVEGRE